jgi:hypothetical protein
VFRTRHVYQQSGLFLADGVKRGIEWGTK